MTANIDQLPCSIISLIIANASGLGCACKSQRAALAGTGADEVQ
jgi:hypothetical protein